MAEPDDSYFLAFDGYLKLVELMSGLRQKLVDQGWSPHNAELATMYLMFGPTGKNTSEKP